MRKSMGMSMGGSEKLTVNNEKLIMDFLLIKRYDNYVEAHIDKGVLEENNIECWLMDENTVTINPFLSNAIGGIKLMVAKVQAERAMQILNENVSGIDEGSAFLS
jgi:Putative prokaryotic signal transducing protein